MSDFEGQSILLQAAIESEDKGRAKQVLREFGRGIYASQGSQQELFELANKFAGALNPVLKGTFGPSVEIRIPRIGEPTDVRWMSFASGTNVKSVQTWGVYDNGLASVQAEVIA